MKLHKLSEKGTLVDIQSISKGSKGFLLAVLFNVGDDHSRKKALPLSRKLCNILPRLNIIGVHIQKGEKDYLPGQVLRVTEDQEIPYEVYLEEESSKQSNRWRLIPQWILFDPQGRRVRSFRVEKESDLRAFQHYFREYLHLFTKRQKAAEQFPGHRNTDRRAAI